MDIATVMSPKVSEDPYQDECLCCHDLGVLKPNVMSEWGGSDCETPCSPANNLPIINR